MNSQIYETDGDPRRFRADSCQPRLSHYRSLQDPRLSTTSSLSSGSSQKDTLMNIVNTPLLASHTLKTQLEIEACQAFDMKNYPLALHLYKQIDGAKISFNKGQIHLSQEEYRQAVAAFTDAIEKDEFLAVAHFQCGVAYYALGDWEQARKAFAATRKNIDRMRLKDLDKPSSQTRKKKIGYQQLGLECVLWNYEALFNEGLCYMMLSKNDSHQRINAITRFNRAKKDCDDHVKNSKSAAIVGRHSKITEIQAYPDGFAEPFKVESTLIFRPRQMAIAEYTVEGQIEEGELPNTSLLERTYSFISEKVRRNSKPSPVSSTSEPLLRFSLGSPPLRKTRSATLRQSVIMRSASLPNTQNLQSMRNQQHPTREQRIPSKISIPGPLLKDQLPRVPRVADAFMRDVPDFLNYEYKASRQNNKTSPTMNQRRSAPVPQNETEQPTPLHRASLANSWKGRSSSNISFQPLSGSTVSLNMPSPLAPWEKDPTYPTTPITQASLKVKVHSKRDDDIYIIKVKENYDAIVTEVRKRQHLAATESLTLEYKDIDGDRLRMVDDEDLRMALSTLERYNKGKLELWCI